MADTDNDGKITMFELQSYIQANVSKYSEFKQIPLITGDLSKSFFKVDPPTLAALKKEKEQNYPLLARANTKGIEDKYVDSLSPAGKKIWYSYQENLEAKRLIWPKDTNALKDYRLFARSFPDNPLLSMMRRNLASALNNRFDSIVSPLLRGQTSYSTRDACYYAAMELDSCMGLLGDQHYMYRNLKARKLFMEAMSFTWALGENEYNYTWRTTVEKSLKLLEESYQYEPNASYTLMALGTHYYFLYEYEKANQSFRQYLALRPYDVNAKYSLALMYSRLKQYKEAEALFKELVARFPEDVNLRAQLFDIYWKSGDHQQSLDLVEAMIAKPEERMYGYFYKGLYYSREDRLDSTLFYYREADKVSGGNCIICDNNTGHAYFVHGQTDSARRYFNKVLAADSTYTFGHFNLGVIDEREGKVSEAISRFLKAIQNATGTQEGFVTNFPLYLGKRYDSTDRAGLQAFRKKMFVLNMQYLSYLSILYTYIRVPGLIDSSRQVNYLFEQLFTYKQHESQTWFHRACYFAMKKDTAQALASLDKALQLGFGSYFQVLYDRDLAPLRSLPRFRELVKEYFPKGAEQRYR